MNADLHRVRAARAFTAETWRGGDADSGFGRGVTPASKNVHHCAQQGTNERHGKDARRLANQYRGVKPFIGFETREDSGKEEDPRPARFRGAEQIHRAKEQKAHGTNEGKESAEDGETERRTFHHSEV